MLRKLEMARNVRCGPWQKMPCAVVHVLAGLGGYNQKFSSVIHKLLEKKTTHTALAFCNLEQTSTSLYVIPNLRIM